MVRALRPCANSRLFRVTVEESARGAVGVPRRSTSCQAEETTSSVATIISCLHVPPVDSSMTRCSEVVGQMHLRCRLMAWDMCSNLHVRASCDNQGVPTNLTRSVISTKSASRCNLAGVLNGASVVIDSMRLRRGDQEHVAQPTAADCFRISLPRGCSTARRAPATRTLCDSLKQGLESMGKQCPLWSRTCTRS
jgi:hypothetical protein